jgi:hypothetical protein
VPPLETADRYQRAVLWPFADYGDDGRPLVGDPVEVRVRWTWEQRQAANAQGQPIMTSATVVVDRDVALGSRMWEGELADWYGTGSVGGDDFVMEVASVRVVPDVRNRAVRQELGLVWFRDTPR